MNFAEFIFDRVRNHAGVAYYCGDQQLLFRDLEPRVRETAGFLDSRGVDHRSTVMINLPNSPEWPVIFYALTLLGARIMVTHANLDPISLKTIAARIKSTHIIAVAERDLGPINVLLEHITHDRSGFFYNGSHDYNDDDLHFMITTSGTSGRQKIVKHRHISCVNLCREFDRRETIYQDLDESSVILCTANLNFLYGLGTCVCLGPSQGVPTVIFDQTLTPKNIIGLANRFRVTHLFSGPAGYMLMTKYPGDDLLPDSVKCCVSGGEKLLASVSREFENKFGHRVYDCIGCSELFWFFLGEWSGNIRSGSMGRPFPGHDIKVVNADGTPCPVGEIGYLVVKTNVISAGYFDDAEGNEFSFRDGWFWTNDLVKVDEDGYFFYLGRHGQLHKVHGIWVNLLEVEDYVSALPEITDCLAKFVVDDRGLVEVEAQVVTSLQETAADIRRRLLEIVPPCQMPKFVTLVNEIPRTMNGKKIRDLAIINQS
jgi:benzoate-CoA ligase